MFGLIASALGMAATAGTSAGSFIQAGKQRRLAKEAQMEADKAMASARAKLDVNFLEAVAIQKEPYELQREATLQAAATALEGVREGDVRGAAAGAGRVALATQQGLSEQRAAMSKELQALEMATAQEESRLRDIGVQLDLQEVQGAQQAVADAEAAKRQAIQQGAQGLVSLGQQAAEAAPLYAKTKDSRALARAMRKNPNLQSQIASANFIGNVDVSGVANMTSGEFQDFILQNFGGDTEFFKRIAGDLTARPLTAMAAPVSVNTLAPANQQAIVAAPEKVNEITPYRMSSMSPAMTSEGGTFPFYVGGETGDASQDPTYIYSPYLSKTGAGKYSGFDFLPNTLEAVGRESRRPMTYDVSAYFDIDPFGLYSIQRQYDAANARKQ